jgi:hypothetical protein
LRGFQAAKVERRQIFFGSIVICVEKKKGASVHHGKMYGKTDIGEDTFAAECRLGSIGSYNRGDQRGDIRKVALQVRSCKRKRDSLSDI